MKCYYCFNGLYDYEYEITDEQVIEAIYKTFNIVVEQEAVRFYSKLFPVEIYRVYYNEAYWEYLQEEKSDLLDDKSMRRLNRIIKEENKILYGKVKNML